MIVLLFHERFVPAIRAGHKRQTIRPPRKRPIGVGQVLSLRCWEGKAYRSAQLEILSAPCAASFDVMIMPRWYALGSSGPIEQGPRELDEFARADGFESWSDLQEWYRSPDGYGLPFRGCLIQWPSPKSPAPTRRPSRPGPG
jgi:hypothetical protein